jgi:hypothetical protein
LVCDHDGDAEVRFAKLKNDDMEWWMKTVEAMIPLAKERLKIFEVVATSLKENGDLSDVDQLEIECDERWITKKKSILIHSMKEFDDAIKKASERPAVATMFRDRINTIKRKKAPTVGENSPANKKRTLGMRGLATT